jgi:hypothetical protein
MHILERYALSCGVKIDKPFILEQYYPTTLDKYIVFQTSGKGNSRQYDYWLKVFQYIREYTKDYKILHVGLESDQSVAGVDLDLRGKTSIRQLAYLIKNSSLYLGIDSLSTHLAGHYDKKIVALYSYCYAQNCFPVWGKRHNRSLIEVDWAEQGKPSFSLTEKKKNINTVKPEIVAKAALDHLGVANDLDLVKTLFIGSEYHNPTIEVIPDSDSYPIFIKDKTCNVRMDYHFSEENLLRLASICRINIITAKQIDINILNSIKSKICGLSVIASRQISEDYLLKVKSLGIKLNLSAPFNEEWPHLCEKFFDFKLDKEEIITKSRIKNASEIDQSCDFNSEKIIFSQGKVYSCKLFWEKNQPKLDRHAKVVDDKAFWQESEYFYIYKDERPNL